MSEELQQLLEKIQRDGVAKAEADADAIVAKAKADADSLLKTARAEADATRAQAESDARAFAERANETVRQAARDVVLDVETKVQALILSRLPADVDAALADPQAIAPLALEAVRALLKGGEAEVAAAAKLADALRAQFAAAAVNGVTVVTDETVGTGFSVRLDQGRVEHDFTGTAVREALAKRLRPALAALVK